MTSPIADLVDTARAGLAGHVPDPLPADGAPPQPADDREVIGTALDGQVRAVLSPGGRLRALTVEPAAMALPLADISDAIVAAVNDANTLRVGMVDVTPLVGLLTQVRDRARTEAVALTAGLSAADATVRSMRSAR